MRNERLLKARRLLPAACGHCALCSAPHCAPRRFQKFKGLLADGLHQKRATLQKDNPIDVSDNALLTPKHREAAAVRMFTRLPCSWLNDAAHLIGLKCRLSLGHTSRRVSASEASCAPTRRVLPATVAKPLHNTSSSWQRLNCQVNRYAGPAAQKTRSIQIFDVWL